MGEEKKRGRPRKHPQAASRQATLYLRPFQVAASEALDARRLGCLICHRRFGKTVLAAARLIRSAAGAENLRHRGAYIAPLYRQAKAVTWDYLKAFARPLGAVCNESELRMDFPHNGARITLHGADNPDSLRGLNLRDVVFDEVADMPLRTWSEIVLPMLVANRGRALFMGTPRGKNALYTIWNDALLDESEWVARMYRASETNIIPAEALEHAARTMRPEEYAQEFECSFTAAVRGAYYAGMIEDADKEGRITAVPYEPRLKVCTAWDLGMADSTAIWFFQVGPGGQIRVIDYYEAHGEGLPHYVKLLSSKAYVYDRHYAPHDIQVREFGSGNSRFEIAQSLGLRFYVGPKLPVQDGVDAVRMILPKCWFDAHKCRVGLDALKHYRREFNEKMDTLNSSPVRDWTTHGADAFRYLAVAYRPVVDRPRQERAQGGVASFSRPSRSSRAGIVI